MAPAGDLKLSDPADRAMVARAHERFASERRRTRRRRAHRGALPNLIIIGGLKCGTTSLHHYLNLHPEIAMSRPKELNFFVAELNWPLGSDWYAGHFDPKAPVRGESSPHYTNRPAFAGVPERMRDVLGPAARLIYVVRDPIGRMLSHYLHNKGGGYDNRPLPEAFTDPESSYVARSRYFFQLEPYLEAFGPDRIQIVTREELKAARPDTMRRAFEFVEVDPGFTSREFEREWETGVAKAGSRFRIMDRAVRLPGLRTLDRNFDRLPESLRWAVERLVHDPGAGEAPKPTMPDPLRDHLIELFREDVTRLEDFAGRRFGWLLPEA